jgi:hypothetical protein
MGLLLPLKRDRNDGPNLLARNDDVNLLARNDDQKWPAYSKIKFPSSSKPYQD